MMNYKLDKNTIIRALTVILIIAVASWLVVSYYNKVVREKDRLTAKRLEQSISLVLAKYVGANLTYDNGGIYWTSQNANVIKNGIATVIGEEKLPLPAEKGHYFYIYLESPYTVIKLPYRIENNPHIDDSKVTEDYMRTQYPKDEYPQVEGKVPKLQTEYERSKKGHQKNQIVCLNA